MSGPTFFVEDVVTLKGQPTKIGLVDRTFHDVESHDADPLRYYEDGIKRHKDTPKRLYISFLGSGIPPPAHVLVTWHLEGKTELVPENKLTLMDRSLLEGDVVKRRIKDAQSGTVLRTSTRCLLRPPCSWPEPQPSATPSRDAWTESLRNRSKCLSDIPSGELEYVHQYGEGNIIIYDNMWVGRVDEVVDEVAVRLCNGSVVVVEDPDDLIVPGTNPHDSRSVGEFVETKKGNLRRGRWKYGAYNPNVEPCGYIAEVRTVSLNVDWLSRRLVNGVNGNEVGSASRFAEHPPSWLEPDGSDAGKVMVYDRSRAPSQGKAKTTLSQSDRSHPLVTGSYVRFKDLAGASLKYGDNSRSSHGTFIRIPRSKALGYDMNVFEVLGTRTTVTVLWQDQSISEHESTDLVPDPNVDDDEEVWPGEIVATHEEALAAASDGIFRPAKVGVVQRVNASERIASVRWFANPSVEIIDEDRSILSSSSWTGPLGPITEDVSLYEVATYTALNKRIGDLLILRDTGGGESMSSDWIGEVVELGLDGLLTVRLGAVEETQDIRVPVEQVVWSYGTDDISEDGDSAFLEPSGASDVSMSEDGDEEWMAEAIEETFDETIEYDQGSRMDQDGDDDAWTTESEAGDEKLDRDTDEDDGDVFEDAQSHIDATMSDAHEVNGQDDERQTQADTSHTNMEKISQSTTQSPLPAQGTSSFYSKENAPASFAVLESEPPGDHAFLQPISTIRAQRLRRIRKEYQILQDALPEGVFVRSWESRLDLLRVLIIGPVDTPYEFAPFVIDFSLGNDFPTSPPDAHFHSWTEDGKGPINPNLYEDGKICLSLLGTWHADIKSESWSPTRSTVLQVLVSLLGLVLVKEPYYNEAGFDLYAGTEQSQIPSAQYSERTYFRSRGFILHALKNPVQAFEEEIRWLYVSKDEGAPRLLDRAIATAKEVIARSTKGAESGGDDRTGALRRISAGAVVPLRRHVDSLVQLQKEI